MSTTQKLCDLKLISPPSFLPANIHYEVVVGSMAYGVSSDTSDMDVVGFCIPRKEDIFPHLRGEIPGFGRNKQRFDVWQQHHIKTPDGKEYDLAIYSIIKIFQLCMENNPNCLDVLYAPQHCVLHATQIAQTIREKRDIFLHKGCWHKFKGYAYSQLHKIQTKNPIGKRQKIIEEFGFDVKFAYHVVRLMLEVEQILSEHTLTIDRNAEILKAIRRGEWSLDKIKQFFEEKEKHLESLYHSSTLPYSPRESEIKELLLNSLEIHYGSLENAIIREDQASNALRKIAEIIESTKI